MQLGISLDPETAFALLLPFLIGGVYCVRISHLHERGAAPSRTRLGCFGVGLALVIVATVGPIDTLSDEFAFGHMIQHTMLLDEASLLLAIGLTGPVLVPILRLPGFGRARALMHPGVALALWIVAMYAWHIPVLYQAAEEHLAIHLFEHASFLASGTIMWLALIGPFPKPRWFNNPARAIYAGVVHFSSMGLANILMWSGTVLYPFYIASDRAHGIDPLTDQSLAGAVLMIQGGVVMLCVFFWALLRWAREDTERQDLLDFALDRGIELTDQRAATAAAAGRGGELRERLEAAR